MDTHTTRDDERQFGTEDIILTEEDIATGVPRSAKSCPIAIAIRRCFSLDPSDEVRITEVSAIVVTYGSRTELAVCREYTLPDSAKVFMQQFDTGARSFGVMPFTFRLGSPYLWQQVIDRRVNLRWS